MPVTFQLDQPIGVDPETVFALLDYLPATARWLPPCVSLENVSANTRLASGALDDGRAVNRVGDELHYVFRQGGHTGEMTGEILERQPGLRIVCHYRDRQFEVTTDLSVVAGPGGSVTTQRIEIQPKSLISKMMSPLIRLGLKKQTRDAARHLKRLLETPQAEAAPESSV